MIEEDQQRRHEEAHQAGRSWAAQQLELAGEMDVVADFEGALPEAAAGYVALQTGQLPSLFFADLAQRQLEIDMNSGFQVGASEVLAKTIRRRVNDTPLHLDVGASSEPSLDQPTGTGSIFLAQIEVEKASLEDCIVQSTQALREMARRIEAGERDGSMFDTEGDEIGSFDLSSDEHG